MRIYRGEGERERAVEEKEVKYNSKRHKRESFFVFWLRKNSKINGNKRSNEKKFSAELNASLVGFNFSEFFSRDL